MATLAAAPGLLGADALAAGFRQGRKAPGKIEAILAAIARIGFAASADGRKFSPRRAAQGRADGRTGRGCGCGR